jgi:cell division protein FtsW
MAAQVGKELLGLNREGSGEIAEEEALPGASLPEEGRPFDAVLLAVVIALVGLGLVMVYSASAIQNEWMFGDGERLLIRQAAHVVVGLVGMLVGLRVDYRWYRRLAYPLLIGTLLLLVAVLLFGTKLNNATRWLSIAGVTFQPSEILKLALVVYMAYSLEKKRHKVARFSVGIIPHLMVLGIVAFLLIRQPDFGTTVICAALVLGMLFVAGARLVYIGSIVLIGVALGALAVVTSPYRWDRVMGWLEPDADPLGISYQVNQSLMAIGSGGLFGKGLGAGHGKLGYVPELWNDFIAAAIGEELGILGLAVVCCLFVLLLGRGLKIAFGAREMFGMYLAFGITLVFGVQASVNLGVVTGLLPNTGLTLPFISNGGTATALALFSVGVLLNISMARGNRWAEDKRERDEEAVESRLERKRLRYLKRKSGR